MVPGTGTAINVAAVLAGASLGVLLGDRLPRRVSDTVTDGLGLVTLLVAGLQAADVVALARPDALGRAAVLVVLGAVLLGGIVGSLLRVQDRLESLGTVLRRRFVRDGGDDHGRFVEGFVLASLVFCVGPLTILGSLQDGLGRGVELLAVKSALDGFTSLAFASTLGWGVAASAVVVLTYQGALTAVAAWTGEVLSDVVVSSVTAVGGLLMVAVAIRLLRLREMPVGDLLPALFAAPLLTVAVQALR